MFKRFVSLTLFWSAIILFMSSIVLFIEPHGRVAYWADWRFLGLTKTNWDDLHICSGTLFLVASLIHIYLNWPLITAYLTRKVQGASKAPVVWGSILLVSFITIGTYFNIPPMKQFLQLNQAIKEAHTKRYGNPPFGHAELVPISKLARFLGIDSHDFINALRKAGIKVESGKQSLKDIGKATGMSPARLFDMVMQGLREAGREGTPHLPEMPPPGTGRMTLADVARTYHVSQEVLLQRLKKAGIEASANQTMKEIASSAGLTSPEIYDIIKKDSNSTRR